MLNNMFRKFSDLAWKKIRDTCKIKVILSSFKFPGTIDLVIF